MSVGFGDVTPVTIPERMFVTFVAFFITGFVGLVINNLWEIINKIK